MRHVRPIGMASPPGGAHLPVFTEPFPPDVVGLLLGGALPPEQIVTYVYIIATIRKQYPDMQTQGPGMARLRWNGVIN